MLGDNFPTLVDFKQYYDKGDNEIADIAELLYKENPIWEDIVWRRGNELTGDTFTIRTELPEAYTRMVNQGIPTSKSHVSRRTETTEEFVTALIADQHAMKELYSSSGEANIYLWNEQKTHVYALGDAVLKAFMYGNKAIGAGIRGFMTRLGSLNGEYKDQIIDASQTITPSNAPHFRSILAVRWDESEVCGIYNKHGQMGLQIEDFKDRVPDPEGNFYLAVGKNLHWHAGLRIRDKRYIARLCNIDTSQLRTEANQRRLFELMLQLKNTIRRAESGRTILYIPKDLYTPIENAAVWKTNLALSYDHIQGNVQVTRFAGFPLRKCEIMDFDETKVV